MTRPSTLARAMHRVIEPINSIAYFAPEQAARWKDLGLEPLTQGYFGGRSSPLGPVAPEVVAALFFNFNPAVVSLGVPSVWEVASPSLLLQGRSRGMQATFEALGVPTDGVAEATDLARRAVDAAPMEGRPLAAANATVEPSGHPLGDLWQAVTTLREHRGDGHVALLTAENRTAVEALVLFANWPGGLSRRFLQATRGWDDDAWREAVDTLTAEGLMDEDGLTEQGRAYRDDLEHRTDEAAATPWERLGEDTTRRLWELLQPMASMAGAAFPRPFPVPDAWPA